MNRKKKKYIFISTIIIGLVLLIGSTAFYIYKHKKSQIQGAGSDQYNYPGPTEDELREVDENKQKYSQPSSSPNSSTGANPVISSVDQSSLRALVQGVIEEGGTCTATYSKGGVSFTKSTSGIANAKNTICEPIYTNNSDFNSSGEWSVFVSYNNGNSSGVSEPKMFEVVL